jgi:hypothetical protein
MTRTIVRISTAGLVSMMALAISAANAQEAGAQVIGTVNGRGHFVQFLSTCW